MAQNIYQQLRQSETLVAYLRSTIEEKDERLSRAEHELSNMKGQHIQQISQLSEQFGQQITALQNELEATKLQLTTQEQVTDGLSLARKENLLLRAYLEQQRDENITLRYQHKSDIYKTRDEVMQIRAGLAAEFQVQLDSVIQNEVHDKLAALPGKARIALGEKELLRVQLRQREDEMWDLVHNATTLRSEVDDLRLQLKMASEEREMLNKRNRQILMREKELITSNNTMKQQIDEFMGQEQLWALQRDKIRDLEQTSQGLEDRVTKLSKRLQIAISGLKRVCSRHKLDWQQYYIDPYATVKLYETLPSITTYKGRFVVPDV